MRQEQWSGAPLSKGPFFLANKLVSSASAMCGMIRFYCFHAGISFVEDVPKQDAKFARNRLISTGVTIYFETVL